MVSGYLFLLFYHFHFIFLIYNSIKIRKYENIKYKNKDKSSTTFCVFTFFFMLDYMSSRFLRFLVTSGFSLASQSKTVTKGEDARRENPKGNKEIWESREMS